VGADLFDSYVSSLFASMALSVSAGFGFSGMILPLAVAAGGILASIIGFFFVRSVEDASQGMLLTAFRKGVLITSLMVILFSCILVQLVLGPAFIGISGSIISGLIAGVFISFATEYYTSSSYRPTRAVSESALTGPASVIVSGLEVGMLASAVPVLLVSAALLSAFYFAGGFVRFEQGLYGIGMASVGLLTTASIGLASSAYGPIADIARGNAHMSGLDSKALHRTDVLDSLGNTTAAMGKGFAIASSVLTTLVLIVAYKDLISKMGGSLDLRITNPRFLAGLLIGGMMPLVFCALLIRSVGRTAGKIVVEIRRQFREIRGIVEGTEKPDYARSIQIGARTAQKQLIPVACLALAAPVFAGWFLGNEAETGFLLGVLVTGFVLGIMMAAAGGAWDNAKKFIEHGEYGGKGALPHQAALVGDAVGDPFKDTAGPSLNILLKLMSLVAILFAPFILNHSLFR
jgi:K(+)-stimulated pyrophosphate-energized sodium pump